jgi:hypothetical protein
MIGARLMNQFVGLEYLRKASSISCHEYNLSTPSSSRANANIG